MKNVIIKLESENKSDISCMMPQIGQDLFLYHQDNIKSN